MVTDTNHVQWDKVVEIKGVPLDLEAEDEQDMEVPTHGSPVTGQYLVKLIKGNYVQLIGERVTKEGYIQTGNFEEYFSSRSNETNHLEELPTKSGYIQDYIGIMLANGRYRIVRSRDVSLLEQRLNMKIDQLRSQSDYITGVRDEPVIPHSDLESMPNPITNLQSSDNIAPPVQHTERTLPVVPQPSATSILQRDCDVENNPRQDTAPTSTVQEILIPATASRQTRSEIEPPRYRKGKSGIIESIENKTELVRVGKELKTCKSRVTRMKNQLLSLQFEVLPLKVITRKREEFQARLNKLEQVWQEKLSYMEPRAAEKEAEQARNVTGCYRQYLEGLRQIELLKVDIVAETPKTSRRTSHVPTPSSSSDEGETGSPLDSAEWTRKVSNFHTHVKTLKKKQSNIQRTENRVGFATPRELVFEKEAKKIETSTPAPQAFSTKRVIGGVKSDIETENEQLRRELAQLKKEGPKFTRSTPAQRSGLPGARVTFAGRQNTSSDSTSIHATDRNRTDPQISNLLSVIERRSQDGPPGRSTIPTIQDTTRGPPSHYQSARPDEHRIWQSSSKMEYAGQSQRKGLQTPEESLQSVNQRRSAETIRGQQSISSVPHLEENNRDRSKHERGNYFLDNTRTRNTWASQDYQRYDSQNRSESRPQDSGARPEFKELRSRERTGSEREPQSTIIMGYNPNRPLDKIPNKLNIQKFSGSLDQFELFKAKFRTLVESQNIPLEEKAVHLVDNLEKDPLKLANAVVAGRIDVDSLSCIWGVLETHYGGERRRKTMPLARLRNMPFIAKFNKQELLTFHIILTEIRSYYAYTDEQKLWEENSEIVSIARERISDGRQSEYFGHLRYMSHRDNFISFSNWIKEKLEIHQRVEESSVIRKGTEKSYLSGGIGLANNEDVDRTDGYDDSEDREEITATGQFRIPSKEKEKLEKVYQTTEESLRNKSSEPPKQLPKEQAVCIFCKKNHLLYACLDFEKISHQDRNKFVRSNRVCFHCLNTGHIASKCDYYPKRVCNMDGCQASHHRKLHPPKDTTSYCYEEEYPDEVLGGDINDVNMHGVSGTTNHTSDRSYTTVRTTPVILKIGDKKRRVIAALDACSNNTNISEDLAKELGLHKKQGEVTRYVDHMEHTRTVKSNRVQFELCPLDESAAHPVNAWTVKNLLKNLPVINWKEEVKGYPHLCDLEVPETLPGDKVEILLGTDYAHLQGVIKSRIGGPGEPIAEFTALGLAFSGELKNCISNLKSGNHTGLVISRDFITLTNTGNVHPEEVRTETTEEQTQPAIVLEPNTPDVTLEPNTPDVMLERNTPDVMLEQNTPDVTLEQNTQDVTLEENMPGVVLEQNTPDITLEPSPPDVPGAVELRTESATSVTSCEEQIEGATTRRPYTIVIEGNIGSGKTSFLELIRASSPETVDI